MMLMTDAKPTRRRVSPNGKAQTPTRMDQPVYVPRCLRAIQVFFKHSVQNGVYKRTIA